MSKFFNTAGLCIPGDHYMVNPLHLDIPVVDDIAPETLYHRATGEPYPQWMEIES